MKPRGVAGSSAGLVLPYLDRLISSTASLRAGAPGLAGLTLSEAVEVRSADAAHSPDVVAKFSAGAGFAAYVGKTIALVIELRGGARAYSVAWR